MSWVTFNACSCSFRAHTNVTLSTAADGINEEKNDCWCVPHLLLPRTRWWRHTDKPHHSPSSSCMEALRFAVTLESQSCTWLVECCDKQWTLINAVRMIFRDLLSNFSSLSHHFSFFFKESGGFFCRSEREVLGVKLLFFCNALFAFSCLHTPRVGWCRGVGFRKAEGEKKNRCVKLMRG